MNTRLKMGSLAVLGLWLVSPDAGALLQTLCNNSPENPTLVLGLIGAAAAAYPVLRARGRALFSRQRRG